MYVRLDPETSEIGFPSLKVFCSIGCAEDGDAVMTDIEWRDDVTTPCEVCGEVATEPQMVCESCGQIVEETVSVYAGREHPPIGVCPCCGRESVEVYV